MKRVATLLLALAATTAQANTQFLHGNDLLATMNADSPTRNGIALGYVMGVFDRGTGILHCAPVGVTAGQARDMVKNYLEKFPQDRHNAADVIVTHVLMSAWPCPRKGSTSL